MTTEQYSKLHYLAQEYMKSPLLRKGQSYMIALHNVDVDLYKEIRGTDVDPFYDNSKIPAFDKKLVESCR